MWDFLKGIFKYSPVGWITEGLDALMGNKPSGVPSFPGLFGRTVGTGINHVANAVGNGVSNAMKWISEKGSDLWDEFKESNIYRKYTGSGLTDAEREANEWTAQREDTSYQRTTGDMLSAGLNPAMMYGGSAGATSASGSVSPGSSPGLPQMLPAIMQMLSLPTQLAAIRAQTDRTNAEAEGIRIDNQTRGQRNDLSIEQMKSALKNDKVRRALDRQGINESKARESLDLANAALAGIDAKTREDINTATWELINARRAATWRDSDVKQKQLKLMDAQISNLWQDSIYKAAAAYAQDANAVLAGAVKEKTEQETETSKKYGELLEAQRATEFARLGILQYDEKARKWEVDHQALRFWSDIVNKTATTVAAGYGAYNLGKRGAPVVTESYSPGYTFSHTGPSMLPPVW